MTIHPGTPCRLCRDLAVAVFDFDQGCACVPEPGEQALCMTHALKATPRGNRVFLGVLPGVPDGWAEYLIVQFGPPVAAPGPDAE